MHYLKFLIIHVVVDVVNSVSRFLYRVDRWFSGLNGIGLTLVFFGALDTCCSV